MPWKNGGGVTHEVFIHPEGSSLEKGGFQWRLSSANISEAGQFSLFPGYDRVIFLLSGKGMNISVDGSTVSLLSHFDSLRFHGERETSCSLVEGPVTDFNIFCRRASYTCEYRQLAPKREAERLFLPGDTTILFCLRGEAAVEIDEERHLLREMDMIGVLGHTWGQSLSIRHGETSRLLFITLSRRRKPAP
ncbi:MAG: HutD family protein [Synergistaceae bacterium]|nr:HutD family protein [Synergistaceae bacterium]